MRLAIPGTGNVAQILGGTGVARGPEYYFLMVAALMQSLPTLTFNTPLTTH